MGCAMSPSNNPIMAQSLPESEIEDADEGDSGGFDFSPIIFKLAPDACGVRLDKALAARLPQYSRSRIQQWIEAGNVTLDGKTASSPKTTVLGDEAVVILPQAAPE